MNFSQLQRLQRSREQLFHEYYGSHISELNQEPGEDNPLMRQTSLPASAEAQRDWIEGDRDQLRSRMWEMEFRPKSATISGESNKKSMEMPRVSRITEEDVEEVAKTMDGKEESLPSGIEEESAESKKKKFMEPSKAEDSEVWDSKITFILATIGFAVGLGNIWRFPYLAQKNGGGAFLIPYFIMLLAEGLPLFVIELAIGQRLRKGSIGVWKEIHPYLGGIGIAAGVVSFNVALYYNTIIAWCLFYFFKSFWYPLPWAECPETILDNGTSVVNAECSLSTPTQHFWYRTTLDISSDINSVDSFNWAIGLSLLISWIIVYGCMVKGITENPKVIWITATYPYIVLVIFFVRAMMLEGMEDGVHHLFKPKWERLLDPEVWLDAGTQIFFSLGLAFGGLIAYASYNPVNSNCVRDAIMVAAVNFLTSLFAAIVIFAIMGFKANTVFKECMANQNKTIYELFGTEEGVNIDNSGFAEWTHPDTGVVHSGEVNICDLEKELENSASGTGLAFILFTEAVNQFPGGNFWAILFFLMLFTLGLDSQFGTLQGVIQCIVDLNLLSRVKKPVMTGILCGVGFLISMVFAHGGGNYVFTLFDNFSGSVPLLIIAFFEIVGIAYIYGLQRFSDDIELMTGSRPSVYWLFCWKYLAPFAMIVILISSITNMIIDGSDYEAWDSSKGLKVIMHWPVWAQIVIGFLILVSAIWIPVVALARMFGFKILGSESSGWWPEDELRDHYKLKPHKITWIERYFFGFRDDGREGLCCPTQLKSHVIDDDEVSHDNEK